MNVHASPRGLIVALLLCSISFAKPDICPFVNGMDIKNSCDVIIDETTCCNPKELFEGAIIFVKTDYLALFFSKIRPLMRNKYILVSHMSNLTAPENTKPVLNDPLMIAWYAEHVTYNHPKLRPLPAGIRTFTASTALPQKQLTTIEKVISSINDGTITKKFLLQEMFQHPITQDNYEEYLTDLAQTEFSWCPCDTTDDEHRIWESLMVGTIPIIKTSWRDHFYMMLPVCIVESWDHVNRDYLERQKDIILSQFPNNKIYSQYWINLIKNVQINAKK